MKYEIKVSKKGKKLHKFVFTQQEAEDLFNLAGAIGGGGINPATSVRNTMNAIWDCHPNDFEPSLDRLKDVWL